jgi:hypothetical protein
MVPGVQLFNLYLAITIKYINKYTATMDHGKYFQYYIQGDVLYQDHINHLLIGSRSNRPQSNRPQVKSAPFLLFTIVNMQS